MLLEPTNKGLTLALGPTNKGLTLALKMALTAIANVGGGSACAFAVMPFAKFWYKYLFSSQRETAAPLKKMKFKDCHLIICS